MSTPEKKTKTPVDVELSTMRRIIALLNALDPEARSRVLNYAADRVSQGLKHPPTLGEVARDAA